MLLTGLRTIKREFFKCSRSKRDSNSGIFPILNGYRQNDNKDAQKETFSIKN